MSFVAFNRRGNRIASDAAATPKDRSGDLTIWTFPGGRLVRRLPGQVKSVSPDWTYYATGHDVRKLDSGDMVVAIPAAAYAHFAFGPRKSELAEAAQGRVQLIDLRTGKPTRTIESRSAFSLAFSPRGDLLATGHWDVVSLWNPASGRRVATLRGLGHYAQSLAFSPDGKLLAVGADWGVLQIWDVRHRKRLHSVDLQGGDVSEAAFSPDGRHVAVGTYGTGTAWLIDLRTGKVAAERKVSDLGCGSVAFSPNGRFLVTPSTGGLIRWPYDHGGSVRVFRVSRR